MKKMRLNSKARKAFRGGSRGFSLIEVVIAIALIGIIGVAILTALSTASLALIIVDQRATAESLARSQMEYVKSQKYSAGEWDYEVTHDYRSPLSDDRPTWWDENPAPLLPDEYASCAVKVEAKPLHNPDEGIQMITVTVTYYTVRGDNEMRKQIYTLADYNIGEETEE